MAPGTPFTLVTVAYGGDYGLLRLQARSLSRYLASGLVDEIIVVENPRPGEPVFWREILLAEYGSVANKVRFVEAGEIAEIPSRVSGWFSQQILKLMVARFVRTPHYLVVDGKNHLVRELKPEHLIGSSGKPRSYLMSYEGHPMRQFFENTVGYFGLVPDQHVRSFLPTTTPFMVPADLARSLVADVEKREGRDFPDAFLYDGYNRTEFFLLAAYLLSLGHSFSDCYDLSGQTSPAIWPESTGQQCLEAIRQSEALELPFFAVHRRALPTLGATTRHELAGFWVRRGLFDSMEAPLRFLASPLAADVAINLSDRTQ